MRTGWFLDSAERPRFTFRLVWIGNAAHKRFDRWTREFKEDE